MKMARLVPVNTVCIHFRGSQDNDNPGAVETKAGLHSWQSSVHLEMKNWSQMQELPVHMEI